MDMFSPISATIGGALIGLSAVMLMALNGRIAGISGVFSGAVFGENGDRSWRLAFMLGLITAPALWTLQKGVQPNFDITNKLALIIAGGLLVGFGTRLGSGCTSGHGICGLSRLSPRSMISVALFMMAGMAMVALTKIMLGG